METLIYGQWLRTKDHLCKWFREPSSSDNTMDRYNFVEVRNPMMERWISRPALCRWLVFRDDDDGDGLSLSPFSEAFTVEGKRGKTNKNLKRKKTNESYTNFKRIYKL